MSNEYRFGASLFPIVDLECDRVNRVLVFGGIDIKNPKENATELSYMQLDFTTNTEFFKPLGDMERLGLPDGFKVLETWQGEPDQPGKAAGLKVNKKFKEDEK